MQPPSLSSLSSLFRCPLSSSLLSRPPPDREVIARFVTLESSSEKADEISAMLQTLHLGTGSLQYLLQHIQQAVYCDRREGFVPFVDGCFKGIKQIAAIGWRSHAFADEIGVLFMETSAKNATNAEHAFMAMAVDIKN